VSYCQSLTTEQVINVLKQEQDRVDRYKGTGVRREDAEELVRDARETLIRRGIDPDRALAGTL